MQLFKPRGTGWGWRVGSVTMLPRRAAPVSARSAAERSSTVHRGVPWTRGTMGRTKRAIRTPQLMQQWLTRPGQGQEQWWPSHPHIQKKTLGSTSDQERCGQGILRQQGCSTAVCMAVWVEGPWSSACSTRDQWHPPSRNPWPLYALHPPPMTQLPRRSSGGNTLPPRCQAAGSALLLHQYRMAAETTSVGSAPR